MWYQEHFNFISNVSSDPHPTDSFWEKDLGKDGSYLWPFLSQKMTVLFFLPFHLILSIHLSSVHKIFFFFFLVYFWNIYTWLFQF